MKPAGYLAVFMFTGWIFVQSLRAAPAAQIWSLAGVVVVGLLLMLIARFGLRSSFFQTRRESAAARPGGATAAR